MMPARIPKELQIPRTDDGVAAQVEQLCVEIPGVHDEHRYLVPTDLLHKRGDCSSRRRIRLCLQIEWRCIPVIRQQVHLPVTVEVVHGDDPVLRCNVSEDAVRDRGHERVVMEVGREAIEQLDEALQLCCRLEADLFLMERLDLELPEGSLSTHTRTRCLDRCGRAETSFAIHQIRYGIWGQNGSSGHEVEV